MIGATHRLAVEGMVASSLVWKANYDKSCSMHKFFDKIASNYDLKLYCKENSLELYFNKEKQHYNYHTMHKWSIDNVEKFWEIFFKFSGIICSETYNKVLDDYNQISDIPKWFVGCKLNYAENVLKYNNDSIAITQFGEGITETHTTFSELNNNVKKLANAFRGVGIKKGDVIGSILPNVTFTIECMLAAASIGAIWTCASPETQAMGIVMRMKQTNPKLLISYDKVCYNGKSYTQMDKLCQLEKEMPSLKNIIVTNDIAEPLPDISLLEKGISYEDFMMENFDENRQFFYEQVPFDHPLFIMYSSGTTGIPKGLVHSVGGTLIQHLKDHIIHESITSNDVFFYYTIIAWMMWNWLVTSLATGCRIVAYNGSPFYPDHSVLWNAMEKYNVTIFGAGAAYYQIMENAQYHAKTKINLSSLRMVLSTGSVLPGHTYDYLLNHIKNPLQICSIAAATDVISCFGGVNPFVNVYRGQVQNINLAMGVESWVDQNKPVSDSPGELVVIKPFPSMPVCLWNDENKEKYISTYFSKFQGVWSQGDFCQIINSTRGIIMLGRSDATLNPYGVRFGSAEIYAVVEKMSEIDDSLCVGQLYNENERVILFLKLRPGVKFTADLEKDVRNKIRVNLSARHVPAIILPIADIPYTLTGKKIEMAVKRILCRQPFIIQRESLRNPSALDLFFDYLQNGTL